MLINVISHPWLWISLSCSSLIILSAQSTIGSLFDVTTVISHLSQLHQLIKGQGVEWALLIRHKVANDSCHIKCPHKRTVLFTETAARGGAAG